ncbi:MAG: DUF4399 domain-containing protein [Rubrivivax sp.]|nr:DUF4399 domain-containing protein [Rubrivivax sp.]
MPRSLFRSTSRPVTSMFVAGALLLATACATREPALSVSLLEPANGATVTSPFEVRFGLQGMAVQPAGNMTAGTGHHHLLINQAPVAAGTVVTFSPQHLHFGASQIETMVTLTPGSYTLTAQFANGAHQSYGPAMSQTITVTVK